MKHEVTPWTRDQYGPPIWPPFEKLQALLEKWQQDYPGVLSLEIPGTSVGGRPVYAIKLTDPETDDENKERILLTALHAGVERNATTTVFSIIEWLLAGDPLARDILRHQVVVCMPVPNPDGYVEGTHGNVYAHWTFNGPRDPENMPEAVAVQKIMDRYQFEVHADLHGLSLEFEKYIMLELSGFASSNPSLRPYHRDVAHLMDEAALVEGYPYNDQEADREQLFWGPQLDEIKGKLWSGRPQVYAAIYGYNRYHTMITATEVSWERSGFLRHRRLLQIGQEIWPGERYPGYPVRVTMSNGYHMVAAYGQTAAARRRSRVELWSKHGQVTHGMADPFVEGKLLYVVSVSNEAAERWLSDETLRGFSEKLSEHAKVESSAIRDFVQGWPRGQNHPDAHLALMRDNSDEPGRGPIEHGLSLRVRISFDKARILDLRLNGHLLPRSETDGYVTWISKGFTVIQINIPPGKSRTEELFIVTCEYDPGEKRRHWTGWRLE